MRKCITTRPSGGALPKICPFVNIGSRYETIEMFVPVPVSSARLTAGIERRSVFHTCGAKLVNSKRPL